MVIADLTWHDGAPVVASPRQILQGPDRPARRARPAGHGRHRAGVRGLRRLLHRRRRPPGTATSPRPTPTTWTTRSWAPPGSSRCCASSATAWPGRACQVESAKGECNLGQHEIAFRYAEAVTTCDNHSIYKTGSKEIADAEGMSITFMAKPNAREGNSCHIHLSVRGGRRDAGDGRGPAARAVRLRRALHRGPARDAVRADPVARAEHQLLQALRAGQFRAHRGPVGRGQPDLRDAAGRARGRAAGGEPGAGRRREPLPGRRGHDRRRAARRGP